MKYRNNMTAKEIAQLLAECEAQEQAYAKAAEFDAANSEQPEDAEAEEAAEEQSFCHFNRYIAGDRR